MRMLCDLTGGETHGCIYWGTARREKYALAKGIWPEGGDLGAALWRESACRSGATLKRLDRVIATLPPLLAQRIAAGCHLDPQGQGTARHGSASVRTDTQTMPASATNHTRGSTPAHARLLSCAECERGMDFIQWRDGEKREPLTHLTL